MEWGHVASATCPLILDFAYLAQLFTGRRSVKLNEKSQLII